MIGAGRLLRRCAALTLATGGAVALAASGTAPAVAAVTHGAPVRLAATRTAWHTAQSNNWSGYNEGALAAGGLFHSISAQWVVPTATQHTAGQAEASASWVGLGGGCVDSSCLVTDPTLIQAGTEQDVAANGTASYSAWYELIPAPSLTVPITVHPGDKMSVAITSTVPEVWTITMTDASNGQHWSTTVPYPSSMDTAEWIEETPLSIGTGGTGITALPNLGTVGFDLATVNGSPANLTPADELQLVDSSGNVIATPSAPDPDTDGFNDCTWATSCSPPSAS